MELLKEIAALSPKIKLEVYDFVLNGDEVINYKIDKIPPQRWLASGTLVSVFTD